MPDLPRVGEEFAGYRLHAKLGSGGMSVVYQAENWRLGNVVALKILAPELADDDTFRTRFLEESQIAASLNHPHVVPIVDAGASGGLLFIAMRYVAGTDLRQMIAQRGTLEPGTAVHLLGQAALALDAAHRRGLVHRDVKPANLLLERTSDDADPDHLYLADFGITRHIGGPGRLTTDKRYIGTPLYLAPEQARELTVLGPADQYALGCVLYECLTGRVPFEKASGPATVLAHIEEPPPRATLFHPGLPPAIDLVFARVLAKHPGQRYASCREFIAAAYDALGTTRGRPLGRLSGGWPPGGGAPPEFSFRATQSIDLPVMEPLPGAWPYPDRAGEREAHRDAGRFPGGGQEPGIIRGAVYPAEYPADDGSGQGRPGKPPHRRLVRSHRNARRLWSMTGAFVLFAGVAAGGGLWTSHIIRAGDPGRQARSAGAPTASELFSVLQKTSGFYPDDLRMSTCVAQTRTRVQCANPSAAIASVTFQTYGSLAALYSDYQEIVGNLTGHRPFADVENKDPCSAIAPDPTGESTWNHSDGYFTKYSVARLASGKLSTDTAMGRVFCTQKPDGSAVMVWTQNSGDLLGYATGGEASHEQVWNWFYPVHHNIIFPGQPGMTMSPTATGTAGTGKMP